MIRDEIKINSEECDIFDKKQIALAIEILLLMMNFNVLC